VVLVDTGMHEAGSMAQLERALDQVNLRLDHVRLLVCTHAHSDHWGQAAPIRDRAGCEFWMHPNHDHATRAAGDPEAARARRLEIGRQSGVPAEALRRYAERLQDRPSGIERVIEPDQPLVEGVEIETDLGTLTVHETPGHAPSHVCLFQRERRLLLSGDHVLGRVSLYYDYGWTPDPVNEFLRSLDVVQRLDARLGLSGHGRPFVDVRGHIEASRRLARERLDAVRAALGPEPRTALEIAPNVHGEPLTPENASWLLSETLCYLHRLELAGQATPEPEDEVERWRSS
jgi:glyoxylase-like metal-dependent hydrolase (beta-lactamase superfamily II)